MNLIRLFSLAVVLAIALLCASAGNVLANPVDDTFTATGWHTWKDDPCVTLNDSPIPSVVIDEHGGPSAWWASVDQGVGLAYLYGACGGTALQVSLTNASSHTMWTTMLAFEQNAYDWKENVLAANSWDAEDSTLDASIAFGDIVPGQTVTRYINLKTGYATPALLYDSAGLDSGNETPGPSNLSITHAAPEPVSSILFITGAATLGFRRFIKKRKA